MVTSEGDLERQCESWTALPPDIHIFDFKHLVEIKEKVYRLLILFNHKLKAKGKKLYLINAPQRIQEQFAQAGLSGLFPIVKSKEEAIMKSKPPSNKGTLDVSFINPFVIATDTVLSTQANTKIKPGKPFVKKPTDNLPVEIAGVINLTNPAFTGSISLCFPAEVFLKIYENMVGEKHTSITSEIEDAAGELLNIIFGQAKTILNDKLGHSLQKALPTILSGMKMKLRHKSTSPVIILPFESAAGAFHIEIVLERE